MKIEVISNINTTVTVIVNGRKVFCEDRYKSRLWSKAEKAFWDAAERPITIDEFWEELDDGPAPATPGAALRAGWGVEDYFLELWLQENPPIDVKAQKGGAR